MKNKMRTIKEEQDVMRDKNKKEKFVPHVQMGADGDLWVQGRGRYLMVSVRFKDLEPTVVGGITFNPGVLTTMSGLIAAEILNPHSSYNSKIKYYKRFVVEAVEGFKVNPSLVQKQDAKGTLYLSYEYIRDAEDNKILHPEIDIKNEFGGYLKKMEEKIHSRPLSSKPIAVNASGIVKKAKSAAELKAEKKALVKSKEEALKVAKANLANDEEPHTEQQDNELKAKVELAEEELKEAKE